MCTDWILVTEFCENPASLLRNEERGAGGGVTVCLKRSRGSTIKESSVKNRHLSCNMNLYYGHQNTNLVHSTFCQMSTTALTSV